MSVLLWVVLGALGVIILWIIIAFNRLVILNNRITNAWSQIDVQLKRRFDLIPNLIETVKGYAKHEKEVFENVTKARNMMTKADTMPQKAKADNMISGALKSLFAVAEAYPDLKANQNFLQLQEELAGTENKLAYSRQFYNDSVLTFNNLTMMFPSNMIAGMFNFKQREFFKTEGAAEREPVKVKF
jgi:LemA protein